MAEEKYTKGKPWISDEIKGNLVTCFEDGPLAQCHWKNKDREGKMNDVFILRSIKQPDGKFKESIEFTDIGLNLIKGTELEKKLPSGKNVLELN